MRIVRFYIEGFAISIAAAILLAIGYMLESKGFMLWGFFLSLMAHAFFITDELFLFRWKVCIPHSAYIAAAERSIVPNGVILYFKRYASQNRIEVIQDEGVIYSCEHIKGDQYKINMKIFKTKSYLRPPFPTEFITVDPAFVGELNVR